MSWNITHQCRFQSRTGQQYCVNISKQADTGQNIVQLQGSEHPFVTSEANGDDIFMPIRQQTGYLRVLDNSGGTLIDELLPENNTQKMVTLVNLTTGKTEWIGFLAAEVFTQPWVNELTELEFPLKSALACLSDVTIQSGATGFNRLAMLVYNAITSMFGEGNVPFTELVLIDDFNTVCEDLLARADFSKFFRSETIMNDNTETVIRVGSSYMEAVKAMCQTFGITMRQQGTSLILGRYDDGDGYAINVNVMDWGVLVAIHNSTIKPDYHPQGQILTKDLLPIANFRASNNKLTFVPGGKAATVTLNITDPSVSSRLFQSLQSEIKDSGMNILQVFIKGNWELKPNVWIFPYWPYQRLNNERTKYYVKTFNSAIETLNIQVSDRGGSATESFFYYQRYDMQSFSGYNITNNHGPWDPFGPIDREFFLLILAGNAFNFEAYDICTGAVPCRWSRGNEVLHNGIFLVTDVWRDGDTGDSSARECYAINNGGEAVTMTDCYLNIKFSLYSVINMPTSIDLGSSVNPKSNLSFDGIKNVVMRESVSSLEFTLQCFINLFYNDPTNPLYWNEQSKQWQTDPVITEIKIKDGEIESNKDNSMNIEEEGGFFVYVQNYTGWVQLRILNVVKTNFTSRVDVDGKIMRNETWVDREISVHADVPIYPFIHLMNDITIDIVRPRDITSSLRSSNVYRKTIVNSGFSENKETSLSFGSYNNNFSSPSFLRQYDSDSYLMNMEYTKADGTVVEERPEMHLLNRMVEYYKTMRRTMEAKIATGIDLFRNRFSYNGRKYMAIDKKHDWEREEQEVKFIEVT